MEVSIGCGAVVFGIVVGNGGTRQGAPQGSGGDGQDCPFAQEAVEAAPPGDRFGIFVIVLLADGIPVVGIPPGAEGVAVHGVAAVEQDQQFGIIVVVHHQCPGAHGAAEHGVPQVEHLVGGEGGGDGGRHRIGVGCFGIVADQRGGSTLPVVGNLERPYHLLQVGSVDVLLTVLGDLPGLGAVVGDTVDPLNPNGGKHNQGFGDQHQRGGGVGCFGIVVDQGQGVNPIEQSANRLPGRGGICRRSAGLPTQQHHTRRCLPLPLPAHNCLGGGS